MSARLRGIARETENIVEAGSYRTVNGRENSIEKDVAAALAGTRLYGPEPVPVAVLDRDRTPAIEVTGESSLEAASRMTRERPGRIAVLNYASARNPGGGYLNGARGAGGGPVPGLRAVRHAAAGARFLRPPPRRAQRVLHRPGHPLTRRSGLPRRPGRLLDTPYTVGFLTSPAPNAGVIRARTPQEAHRVPAALAARAERVLEVAAVCGYRRLVLGAWGCGVFQNDPAVVAGAFHALLTGEGRFAGHFEQVVLGILGRQEDSPTRVAFDRVFVDRR